jgi:hypothetical protein
MTLRCVLPVIAIGSGGTRSLYSIRHMEPGQDCMAKSTTNDLELRGI